MEQFLVLPAQRKKKHHNFYEGSVIQAGVKLTSIDVEAVQFLVKMSQSYNI